MIRSEGKAKPVLRMAVRTRSRLSRTAESGRPTVVKAGRAGWILWERGERDHWIGEKPDYPERYPWLRRFRCALIWLEVISKPV